MDFQKLLNEWSKQTPQVVQLGTTSMYYLGLFVEFLEAKQNEQNVYMVDNICPDCGCKSESNSTCTNCGVLDTPK